MTARQKDSQYRKDVVLGIVVNEYIKTVNPVSSGHIKGEYLLDISPATIRNILADLEQDGYLSHPHTSAGRIPTEDGYRYYVDHLMNEIQLLEEEKKRIKHEYDLGVKDLETTLDKTTQVISDLTQYTSIISVDGWGDRIFCKGTSYVVEYPEYQDINKIRNILSALEEKERLLKIINCDLQEKIQIYIGHELTLLNMDHCSLAVSSYKLDNGPSGRIAVLGPTRMNYPKVVSTLDYFSKFMEHIL